MNPQPRSVLVVDDEPGMRMALKANFERDGWKVETPAGASEAVRKCGADSLPLSGNRRRMPDGDGLEFDETSEGSRVLYSGDCTDGIRYRSSGSPGHAKRRVPVCLTKPFSYEQVAVDRRARNAELDSRAGFPNRRKQKLWVIRRR